MSDMQPVGQTLIAEDYRQMYDLLFGDPSPELALAIGKLVDPSQAFHLTLGYMSSDRAEVSSVEAEIESLKESLKTLNDLGVQDGEEVVEVKRRIARLLLEKSSLERKATKFEELIRDVIRRFMGMSAGAAWTHQRLLGSFASFNLSISQQQRPGDQWWGLKEDREFWEKVGRGARG